jgi:hypothetical protein
MSGAHVFVRVWMDPESARRTIGLTGFFSIPVGYRSAEFGLAPMSILIVVLSLAYLAIGFGFSMLSLHELATGRRDRFFNRLLAWSGVVLWLPMLLVVAGSALLVSRSPARSPVPAATGRRDSAIAERRSIRRAARQV